MSTSRRLSTGICKAVSNCFHRHSRLGSWLLVGGTTVFIRASFMPAEVALIF